MATFKVREWNGDEVIAIKNEAVAQGLYMGASFILTEANQIAPIDEGTLTQTADVDVDESAAKAHIFYVTKYAARLHEHPEYNFQRGRQGKWLEKVMLAEGERVSEFIAEQIKGRLG